MFPRTATLRRFFYSHRWVQYPAALRRQSVIPTEELDDERRNLTFTRSLRYGLSNRPSVEMTDDVSIPRPLCGGVVHFCPLVKIPALYNSISARTAARMVGPTIAPIAPKALSPPKIERRIKNAGMFVLPLMM